MKQDKAINEMRASARKKNAVCIKSATEYKSDRRIEHRTKNRKHFVILIRIETNTI